MRPVFALVVGALASALGAVILGEYVLTGLTGVIAGALFGLAIAEIVLTAGGAEWHGRERLGMVGVAVVTLGGLVWTFWISAGHLWRYVPNGAWIGLVVGAAAAPWWLATGVRRTPAPGEATADADPD